MNSLIADTWLVFVAVCYMCCTCSTEIYNTPHHFKSKQLLAKVRENFASRLKNKTYYFILFQRQPIIVVTHVWFSNYYIDEKNDN